MCSISLRLPSVLAAAMAALFLPRPAPGQQISVQTPTFGVSIDADGVLSAKAYPDPTGKLFAKRVANARATLPADVRGRSDLRKVSLVGLDRELATELKAGTKPDQALVHLAGLQRIRYVFFYPEEHDIVIAGPAEGWVEDLSGRAVGLTTGSPTLLLEDLLVALRAYSAGNRARPYIGCSIDPRPEGLANLTRFQKTIPREIPETQRELAAVQVAEGMRQSLGMSNVRVFGVSSKTHFAQVLIEADYRMKLIGIGIEPPPVNLVTFISALNSPKMATMQRWWFTPNYQCVKMTPDRLAMELVGEGVQLQGEEMTLGPDAKLFAAGGVQNRASRLYTTAFTQKYAEIAARAPVFAQLRNMIDLVVSAAFIRQQNYFEKAGWQPRVLLDEAALPVETEASPIQVPCVVNAVWKENRLLVPAGGVSIHPDLALEAARLQADKDGKLQERREKTGPRPEGTKWWWD